MSKPWEAAPGAVRISTSNRVDLRPQALRDRLEPIRPTGGDLIAGLSVFLILIPQGLAYAELAGVPTHLGLVAGTLPAILAAFVVSSPYLQTGPTALTALLVLGPLSQMALPGTPEYVGLAALLALLIGIARLAFGLLRLGIAAYFVSNPVLTGFTTGAALLIIGTQVPAVTGVDVPRTGADGGARSVMSRALEAISDPSQWNLTAVALAALTTALTLGLRRVHRLFPSVLVAVGAAWALAELGVGGEVDRIGDLPSGFPSIGFDLPWSRTTDLLLPAILIAMVGFVEPASIARTYATQKRERWSANQEFLSQGVANVAASAVGAFPVGGSFGRSSLNEAAGARTRWAGLITGVVMLAFLPFVGILETIPRAALATVVITAAFSLVRLDRIAALWQWSKPQMGTALATLIATLVLDPRIDHAIEFGVVLSVAVHLWREIQVYVTLHRIDERTIVLSPYGVMWFGSTNRVAEHVLATLADDPEVEVLIVNLEGVGRLDVTAALTLADLALEQRVNGIDVRFESVPPHAQRLFDSLLDPEPVDEEAADAARAGITERPGERGTDSS